MMHEVPEIVGQKVDKKNRLVDASPKKQVGKTCRLFAG